MKKAPHTQKERLELLCHLQRERRRREGREGPALTVVQMFKGETEDDALEIAAAAGLDICGSVVLLGSDYTTRAEHEAKREAAKGTWSERHFVPHVQHR